VRIVPLFGFGDGLNQLCERGNGICRKDFQLLSDSAKEKFGSSVGAIKRVYEDGIHNSVLNGFFGSAIEGCDRTKEQLHLQITLIEPVIFRGTGNSGG
jgi:hypothetical protein